jgi:CBS domain-containing protein
VAACEGLLAIEPLLVPMDADILEALRRSAAQPATRVVGVVDATGRLVGVLPILRIAEAVLVRVMPETLLSDISDMAGVQRFGHAVEARTAADTMLPPAAVRPDATIAEAFRLMHGRHLSGLYVVNADGRPTGYIDLLELAVAYLGQQAHDPPTTPSSDARPAD